MDGDSYQLVCEEEASGLNSVGAEALVVAVLAVGCGFLAIWAQLNPAPAPVLLLDSVVSVADGSGSLLPLWLVGETDDVGAAAVLEGCVFGDCGLLVRGGTTGVELSPLTLRGLLSAALLPAAAGGVLTAGAFDDEVERVWRPRRACCCEVCGFACDGCCGCGCGCDAGRCVFSRCCWVTAAAAAVAAAAAAATAAPLRAFFEYDVLGELGVFATVSTGNSGKGPSLSKVVFVVSRTALQSVGNDEGRCTSFITDTMATI
mmetsp:Transcript_4709/g.14371  ORF Transcript_4709/g.14371 Transcript_4709/m.14371 type:complete len:260 (-) Transcript_4709:1427-2206(-)